MDPYNEKKEDMIRDMIIEQELRKDLDYAIEYLDQKENLGECIEYLEKLSNRLSLCGWEITPKEIIERIM